VSPTLILLFAVPYCFFWVRFPLAYPHHVVFVGLVRQLSSRLVSFPTSGPFCFFFWWDGLHTGFLLDHPPPPLSPRPHGQRVRTSPEPPQFYCNVIAQGSWDTLRFCLRVGCENFPILFVVVFLGSVLVLPVCAFNVPGMTPLWALFFIFRAGCGRSKAFPLPLHPCLFAKMRAPPPNAISCLRRVSELLDGTFFFLVTALTGWLFSCFGGDFVLCGPFTSYPPRD